MVVGIHTTRVERAGPPRRVPAIPPPATLHPRDSLKPSAASKRSSAESTDASATDTGSASPAASSSAAARRTATGRQSEPAAGVDHTGDAGTPLLLRPELWHTDGDNAAKRTKLSDQANGEGGALGTEANDKTKPQLPLPAVAGGFACKRPCNMSTAIAVALFHNILTRRREEVRVLREGTRKRKEKKLKRQTTLQEQLRQLDKQEQALLAKQKALEESKHEAFLKFRDRLAEEDEERREKEAAAREREQKERERRQQQQSPQQPHGRQAQQQRQQHMTVSHGYAPRQGQPAQPQQPSPVPQDPRARQPRRPSAGGAVPAPRPFSHPGGTGPMACASASMRAGADATAASAPPPPPPPPARPAAGTAPHARRASMSSLPSTRSPKGAYTQPHRTPSASSRPGMGRPFPTAATATTATAASTAAATAAGAPPPPPPPPPPHSAPLLASPQHANQPSSPSSPFAVSPGVGSSTSPRTTTGLSSSGATATGAAVAGGSRYPGAAPHRPSPLAQAGPTSGVPHAHDAAALGGASGAATGWKRDGMQPPPGQTLEAPPPPPPPPPPPSSSSPSSAGAEDRPASQGSQPRQLDRRQTGGYRGGSYGRGRGGYSPSAAAPPAPMSGGQGPHYRQGLPPGYNRPPLLHRGYPHRPRGPMPPPHRGPPPHQRHHMHPPRGHRHRAPPPYARHNTYHHRGSRPPPPPPPAPHK